MEYHPCTFAPSRFLLFVFSSSSYSGGRILLRLFPILPDHKKLSLRLTYRLLMSMILHDSPVSRSPNVFFFVFAWGCSQATLRLEGLLEIRA